MKRIKKFASLMLAVVMVLAMGITAFATEETPTGKITVNNATKGQIYTLYKVFDATVKGDRTEGGNGINYTSSWFTGNEYFSVDGAGNITATEEAKSEDGLTSGAINWLKNNTNSFETKSEWTKTAEGETVEWTNLEEGYYYISTTTGTAVTVTSITPDITVQDKNEDNTITKVVSGGTVMESDDAAVSQKENTAKIGDELTYTVTLKLQPGSENVVFHDVLDAGLTLGDKKDLTVSTPEANDYIVHVFDSIAGNYTPETGKTFNGNIIISFSQEYLDTINTANTEVVITYKATVNENAKIEGDGVNENTANLTYGHNYDIDQSDKTTTHVFMFQIIKHDSEKEILDNAKFKLYADEDGNDEIQVVEESTGVYRVATEQEKEENGGATIVAGTPVIKGLSNGKYWVKEIEAPAGYNKLEELIGITITDTNNMGNVVENIYQNGGLAVENKAGSLLPSTGGIGTTIFYVVGGILVIGAGILLVAKKRMGARK